MAQCKHALYVVTWKTVRLAHKIYAWFSYDSKINPPFGIYSVQERSTNVDWAIASFVKIGSWKFIVYLRASTNLYLYFQRSLPDLTEIQCKRPAGSAVEYIRVSWKSEQEGSCFSCTDMRYIYSWLYESKNAQSQCFFFRIFHSFYLYLYSLLFHLCHGINIYSHWLGEHYCNMSSNILHILSVQ